MPANETYLKKADLVLADLTSDGGALVPKQAALTIRAQPTLYWYLPESLQIPVTLTIVLEGSTSPLVRTKIVGPLAAGIQPVRLTDFGVRLESGRLYKWFIVIQEPYGGEPGRITGGTIERIEPTSELRASLAAASSIASGKPSRRIQISPIACQF